MEDLYNVSDPYGTYQTAGGDKPYEILMRLKAWNNEIRSTISKVNENLGGLHEQQTQILQNIDSIELNVLDIVKTASGQTEQISKILLDVGTISATVGKHTTDIGGHSSQISQLLLSVQGITLNVSSHDTRIGKAEGTISVQATEISSRVKTTDFTGRTMASLIVQDAYSVSLFAQYLNLTGYVTFSSLSNAGQTTIHGSNISTGTILLDKLFGNLFRIGNASGGTALDIYASQGSHRVTSYDSAGFRIEAIGHNLSLYAAGWSVYAISKFWAKVGLQVTGTAQFDNNIDALYGTITASNFKKNSGHDLVDTLYLANMNYLSYNQMTSYIAGLNLTTVSWVNSATAQLEREIVAWANGKFALK